tara:strand:+ start:34 stop:1254 length:1221 start_codon:yes stop_codon:yes gene_type:complete
MLLGERMPAEDEMTINERRKYLRRMRERYWGADRMGRGKLLTEMEAVTGLHRKSLVRLVRGPTLERTPRSRSRGRSYGPEVEDAIRVVWESLDHVCAERLTPALVPTARHLERFGELVLTMDLETQLGQISRATVQRLIGKLSQDTPRLPRRGPERANSLTRAIPMGRLPWDTMEPGHFEADLVHHCGASSSGEYVHTLQLVDVATGWSERVAVLGRSQRVMEAGFRRILKRLPFPILQLHPDNGSEFFNNHLIRFWGEHIVGLKLSRSRPYRKNDNRIVEQKNDTLVRAYLGYDRLETAGQCAALNSLYDRMWVCYNLFQPVLHLAGKAVVDGRLKRRWDRACTPYDRVLDSRVLGSRQQAQLAVMYSQTNPRRLRRQIYQKLERMWDHSNHQTNNRQLVAALAS